MTEQTNDKIKTSTLVMAIIATIITTVVVMELNGMIKHSDNKEDYPVGEYKAIYIEKQKNKQYRLSHKASDQSAICNNGYLFITSDVNDGMQGLLVDYKNRGVKCVSEMVEERGAGLVESSAGSERP